MSNITDRLIADLLSKYKTEATEDSNLELEIRFKSVTKDLFFEIYNGVLADKDFGPPSIELSANAISADIYERGGRGKADKTQYIRKIVFGENGATDSYMTKIRIAEPVHFNDYIKYSVTLSKESEHKKFPTSPSALLRFKIRVSFPYKDMRFDFTLVKHGNIQNFTNGVKTIKNTLFKPGLSPATLLTDTDFSIIDSYEIELEYVGERQPTGDDLSAVKKLFSIVNKDYFAEMGYQEEVYHIAKHLYDNPEPYKQPSHRIKQLLPQAIALSKNTYYSEIYPPIGYYLLIKANGVRCGVSLMGERVRILRSDGMTELKCAADHPVTIVDAEYLDKTQNNNDDIILRIFDVIMLEGQNIGKAGYKTRKEYLAKAAVVLNDVLPEGYKAEAADPRRLTKEDLEGDFRAVLEANYTFKKDGGILTEPNVNYINTRNYKWKPYEYNTIDFLAMKCPQKLLGIKPYEVRKDQELYLLFVGINHQMREKLGLGFIPHYDQLFQKGGGYYPIQFSPSANPIAYLYYHSKNDKTDLHNQIIELGRNAENTEWVFHQVRTDRQMEKGYYGNDFRIAELTYMNYIDPFDITDLWIPSGGYFHKVVSDIHFAPNKYKRFVISHLLKDNLSGVKWVIDLAAGRGADLHRYQEIGVGHTLFVDVDSTAIAELIRRKFSFFANKKNQAKSFIKGGVDDDVHALDYDKLIIKDVKGMTIHTMVADLKAPANELIAGMYRYGINLGIVDGLVCNFALHYMCDTLEHIRNVLDFCAKVIKVDGVFMFTVMDGKAVFDLLKGLGTGQKWESKEKLVTKYAITKKYTGEKLLPCGQMISVLLPFSDEVYDEPLCNVDVVIAEAEKFGFALEANSPMTSMMDKFKRASPDLHQRLTEEDHKYIGLFRYVTLRMIKPKTGGRSLKTKK